MKSEIINGKTVVINETFAESFEVFNELLAELGQPAISENTASKDFGIIGGETNVQLQEWARDYASECHTEACAARNEYHYH